MRSTVLNRNQIAESHFHCENLKDLMGSIENQMQTTGEVVCQYVLNGMTLREDDEKRLSEIKLDEIETLEVRSEKPTALLFDILKNWETEIPRIIEQTDHLASNLRAHGPEGQYTAFVNLIDSCQFLIESLVSIDSVVETAAFLPRENWLKNEKEIADAIGQALSSFEKKDFSLLGDILEYDLANSLQSWFDLLKGLNRRLQEENERDSGALTDRVFKKSGGTQSNPVDQSSSTDDR
jgi:hypothetical protein